MSNILSKLYQDHIHFSKLLNLMEKQIKLFDIGEQPDYDIMLAVMRYMMNYPDLTHHPIEHVIFEKAVEYDESLYPLVKKLTQEHEKLHECGMDFLNILQNIVESQIIMPREKLKSYGLDYIEMLRSHMEAESNGLFIVVADLLDKSDWHEVRQEFMNRKSDPLFGKKTEESFNALYHYIMNA